MADRWKNAFKQVHGKTPTKMDYDCAPDHIKVELLKTSPNKTSINDKKGSRKRPAVQLKRPETFSPMKKRNRTDPTSKSPTTKSLFKPTPSLSSPQKRVLFDLSPQKKLQNVFGRISSTSSFSSPSKQTDVLSNGLLSSKDSVPHNLPSTSTSRISLSNSRTMATSEKSSSQKPSRSTLLTTMQSPSKFILSPLKPILRSSPRKSLFTPDKSINIHSSLAKSPKTPIRSPRKPIRRALLMTNVDSLLLRSTEKFAKEEEEVVEYDDETTELPEQVVNEVSKTKKNLFRYNAKRESAKANGENFVRINLRKKTFVRGKMTADAKRKMVRKQKWKAKFGGKRF